MHLISSVGCVFFFFFKGINLYIFDTDLWICYRDNFHKLLLKLICYIRLQPGRAR